MAYSAINQLPQFPVSDTRANGKLVHVEVLFSGTTIPSTVKCNVPISAASAAAGVVNFSVPTGQSIQFIGKPVHIPAASNQSLSTWIPYSISVGSGTFQLMHWKENAGGTAISGVAPVSGDLLQFCLYMHNEIDGGL